MSHLECRIASPALSLFPPLSPVCACCDLPFQFCLFCVVHLYLLCLELGTDTTTTYQSIIITPHHHHHHHMPLFFLTLGVNLSFFSSFSVRIFFRSPVLSCSSYIHRSQKKKALTFFFTCVCELFCLRLTFFSLALSCLLVFVTDFLPLFLDWLCA